MGNSSLRLSVGAIFTKGPGRIYFYRYQLAGRRKTVSLKTANRTEALKQARALIPIIQASPPEIVATHVEYAKKFREIERNLTLPDIWPYYSTHPDRAIPATVNEQLQYQSSLQEFIDYLANPALEIRQITSRTAEEFSDHLKTTGIAVHDFVPVTVAELGWKNHFHILELQFISFPARFKAGDIFHFDDSAPQYFGRFSRFILKFLSGSRI